MRRLTPIAAAVFMTVPLSITAYAQSSGSSLKLEEIIVTATKRETTLLSTGAAISAFDSGMRDMLGLDTSLDLAARTPSLSVTTFRLSIRGVGRPNLAVGSDPGIGVYFDGVYNTEKSVMDFSNLWDVERLEVLRGPQGTLYGRNSVGGAINLISKTPTDEWSGAINVELGNEDYQVLQGLVSGPLGEKTRMIATLSDISRDGFQYNEINGKDQGQRENLHASFMLEQAWTDNWVTTAKVWHHENDFRQSSGYNNEDWDTDYIQTINDVDTGVTLNFPGMFPGTNFVNARQGSQVENPGVKNEDHVRLDAINNVESKFSAFYLTNEVNLDDYTVKYIGGYTRYFFDSTEDNDRTAAQDSGVDWSKLLFFGTPVSAFTGYTVTPPDTHWIVDQEAQFVSHDVQLLTDFSGDVNFIAGLYYYRGHENQRVTVDELNDELMATYAFFASLTGYPVSDDNLLYDGHASLTTRSYAAYGQLEWDYSERSTLTFGLRYSYDEKEGRDYTFVQFVGEGDGYVNRKIEDDWQEPTWRVALDYELTADSMVYASLSTGYRSGGFNFLKPTSSPEVDNVDPETVTSLELGYKALLMDGRVSLATAVYYNDHEDLQVLKSDVVNGVSVNSYSNAEAATSYGFEAEATALVGEHLIFSGTYSYNHTEYDKYFGADNNLCTIGPLAQGVGQDSLCIEEQDLSGNQFGLTPEHKLSVNGSVVWTMMDMDWMSTVSYMFTGEQYMNEFNVDDYTFGDVTYKDLDYVDSWDRWDARVNVRPPEGPWSLTAFIKNITDDREIFSRGRPSSAGHTRNRGLTDPRTYGLRFGYEF